MPVDSRLVFCMWNEVIGGDYPRKSISFEELIWGGYAGPEKQLKLAFPEFTWLIVRMVLEKCWFWKFNPTQVLFSCRSQNFKFFFVILCNGTHIWWTLLKLQRTLAIVSLSNWSQNAQFLWLVPMSTMRIQRLRNFSSDQLSSKSKHRSSCEKGGTSSVKERSKALNYFCQISIKGLQPCFALLDARNLHTL